jgi:sialic acid synthase SpsE
VGLSDHTATLELSKQAIQMGVPMIERHFKLDEHCVDAIVSLLPEQLKSLTKYAMAFDKFRLK